MSTLKDLSDIHSLVDVVSQSAVATDKSIESTEIPHLTSSALMTPGSKIVDTSWQTIKNPTKCAYRPDFKKVLIQCHLAPKMWRVSGKLIP